MKGRLLGEHDVDRVVRLLATREAIFEVTALDLGLQPTRHTATFAMHRFHAIKKSGLTLGCYCSFDAIVAAADVRH